MKKNTAPKGIKIKMSREEIATFFTRFCHRFFPYVVGQRNSGYLCCLIPFL